MSIRPIVLAAGKGTRMRSALPKVLHRLAGRPLLVHVLDTVSALAPAGMTVVVGHGAEAVKTTVAAETSHSIDWVTQTEQLGTGHAVQMGLPTLGDDETALITYGDVPLTSAHTYQALIDASGQNSVGLLTLHMTDPTGYGRILRENNAIVGIVEQKDASVEQLAITEVNAGVIAIRGQHLKTLLDKIDNNNAQGEYYLTDIIGLAVAEGLAIAAVNPGSQHEVDGVNSRGQLAALERLHQQDIAAELMNNGATLADPARIDVRGTLVTGQDVLIDINVVFEGTCELGDGVSIGPNCVLRNARVGAGAEVRAYTTIEDSSVGENAAIGPYARLRPGTRLGDATHIGNFVETKNTVLGNGSKVNHLSYVGDSTIGTQVNIGAGTIFCNYDGANKHQTTIEDDVFVGSNSALVAPVTIASGATIGAGSTISQDVPAGKLAVSRARQKVLDWIRPVKSPK